MYEISDKIKSIMSYVRFNRDTDPRILEQSLWELVEMCLKIKR